MRNTDRVILNLLAEQRPKAVLVYEDDGLTFVGGYRSAERGKPILSTYVTSPPGETIRYLAGILPGRYEPDLRGNETWLVSKVHERRSAKKCHDIQRKSFSIP